MRTSWWCPNMLVRCPLLDSGASPRTAWGSAASGLRDSCRPGLIATRTKTEFCGAVVENTTWRSLRHPGLWLRKFLLSRRTDLLNTYVFFLQVQDVINSFFHVLGESCHGHTVGVRSSTLGKANIHLKYKETQELHLHI